MKQAMKISYYGSLREHTGETGFAWETPAASLGDLLNALSDRYGEGFRALVLSGGELSPGITALINGRDARQLGGLAAPLAPGDSVFLLPLAGGG